MMGARIVMDPAGLARIDHLGDDIRDDITDEVEREMRRRVPVDTGELEESIHQTGDGVIVVGTDHWAPTEYGSAPHTIRSTGPWPLRNGETGETFGRVVHHPGTPAQPFIRPAVYKKRGIR